MARDGLLDTLEARERGQVDVSIGTSLAIESAFGIYPDAETSPPPIRDYSEIWFALETLFRNLINTLSAKWHYVLQADEIAEVLVEEMRIIDAWLNEQTGGRVHAVFYHNERRNLERHFPHAAIKQPSTNKQILIASVLRETIKHVYRQRRNLDVDFRNFEFLLRGQSNALVNTHLPIDLLSHRRFPRWDLLESHTGTIRKRSSWGHKLAIRDETMPFNSFTLQVFGDNHDLKAQSRKVQKEVRLLAQNQRWSPTSTLQRLERDLTRIDSQEIREHLKKVMSSARSLPS